MRLLSGVKLKVVLGGALLVLLTGCGSLAKMLFPPVSGTWVDAAVVYTHCGVEQTGRVSVSAHPAAEDLTSFTVTAMLPELRDGGWEEQFAWVGKNPSAHPSGGARVSIKDSTATGELTFMHACPVVEGAPGGTKLVNLVFSGVVLK